MIEKGDLQTDQLTETAPREHEGSAGTGGGGRLEQRMPSQASTSELRGVTPAARGRSCCEGSLLLCDPSCGD